MIPINNIHKDNHNQRMQWVGLPYPSRGRRSRINLIGLVKKESKTGAYRYRQDRHGDAPGWCYTFHLETVNISVYITKLWSRVLLCFIKPILGNRYVGSRGFIVSEPRETHPRPEITNIPTLPCPPLDSDNLGCPDPHPAPSLRRCSPVPSFSSSNGPTTTTLTTRGLCPGSSVI